MVESVTAVETNPTVSEYLRRLWVDNLIPLRVFAVTRFGLFVLMYLALALIPFESRPGQWRAFPQNLLVDGWARWDSDWYASVARNGYSATSSTQEGLEGQRNVVFFPAYPILLRAGMMVFGDIYIAGILISNAAFLAALIFLFHLVKQDWGVEVAERTIILISIFPYAMFFSAVYNESLFLLAVVAAFYFGGRGIWSLAAVCCAVAGATRLQGIVLPFGLALLYLEQINFKLSAIRANILWLVGGFAGTVGYFSYLWLCFGYSPGDYVALQLEGWHHNRAVEEIVDMLRVLTFDAVLSGAYPANRCLHLLMLGGSVILVFYVIARVRTSYGFWALASILVSVGAIISFGRYASVMFPLFIGLALLLKDERAFKAVAFISVLLLSLMAVLFAHWHWVA